MNNIHLQPYFYSFPFLTLAARYVFIMHNIHVGKFQQVNNDDRAAFYKWVTDNYTHFVLD